MTNIQYSPIIYYTSKELLGNNDVRGGFGAPILGVLVKRTV